MMTKRRQSKAFREKMTLFFKGFAVMIIENALLAVEEVERQKQNWVLGSLSLGVWTCPTSHFSYLSCNNSLLVELHNLISTLIPDLD